MKSNVQACTLQERKRSNRSISMPSREAPRKCKLKARYIGMCNRRMQMAVPARIRNPISWLHANTRSLSSYEIVERPRRMIYMSSENYYNSFCCYIIFMIFLPIFSRVTLLQHLPIKSKESGNFFVSRMFARETCLFH